jgi:hypothetical protein
MEGERKAAGLVGVRFLYYHCPPCAVDDIFIDVLPRDGESAGDYATRYAAMLAAARGMHADTTDVVVVPVKPPADVALDASMPN